MPQLEITGLDLLNIDDDRSNRSRKDKDCTTGSNNSKNKSSLPREVSEDADERSEGDESSNGSPRRGRGNEGYLKNLYGNDRSGSANLTERQGNSSSHQNNNNNIKKNSLSSELLDLDCEDLSLASSFANDSVDVRRQSYRKSATGGGLLRDYDYNDDDDDDVSLLDTDDALLGTDNSFSGRRCQSYDDLYIIGKEKADNDDEYLFDSKQNGGGRRRSLYQRMNSSRR